MQTPSQQFLGKKIALIKSELQTDFGIRTHVKIDEADETYQQIIASVPGARFKLPGYAYTLEYRTGRTNFSLDFDGTIKLITLG